MIFNESAAASAGQDPVRLFGFGTTGTRLVRALYEGAEGALGDLLADHGIWIEPEDMSHAVRSFGMAGVAFIFIAIGINATDYDAAHAALLAWRASEYGVATIAIVVHDSVADGGNGLRTPSMKPAILPGLLLDIVQGRIDVEGEGAGEGEIHDLQALRWMYGTLRSLAREGFLILEPAWDLDDVSEVLDLPGSQLKLVTRTVRPGHHVKEAVYEGLGDLEEAEGDLELASGLLVILWQAPPLRLTVKHVRQIGQMARSALGAGGQHLILTARIKTARDRPLSIGGCATLILSSRNFDARPGDTW